MENEQHMQLNFRNHMPVVIDGFPPQPFSESHFRSNFFQLNSQNESLIGLPLHEQPFKDLHADKSVSYDGLLNRSNLNYQELCLGGTSLASNSLGTILASRNGLDNDMNNSVVPLQQEVPSESLRAMFSGSCSYASRSSVPTSLNCGYDSLAGDINNKWNQDTYMLQPELNWRTSTSGLEPIPFSGNQDANEWVLPNSTNVGSSHPYGAYHELSLSLATCSPSLPCPATASIQNQCSDTSASDIIHKSQSQKRLASEHHPHRSKELSLGRASTSRSSQSTEIVSESRYRAALQQILSEVANFSLDGLDQTAGTLVSSSSKLPFSSNHFFDPGLSLNKGNSEFCDDGGSFEAPSGSSHSKRELESKKSQLLSLLQVVDDRYNRCLDEIHTVVSAFHAATELDPQLHACFALHTTSFFYKNLRERISNQILAMGTDSGSTGDAGKSLEKSFIQKQWAIQQLNRKDQQLWRPQRGLPERSVSVLRAWMFDNFLHPYPKDAEKHLLAIKSGLTRSQVSNWFINARVRLWKPLVEEMCAELNRRKGSRQDDDGSNNGNNGRSQLSIYDFNQRFDP